MNLTLERLEPVAENGKLIADFLSKNFWAEHSLSGEGSPPIEWGRASSAAPDNYWWSSDEYIGDGWFYVLPEYRNLKDQIPPSHLLIDAVIEYAKEQDKPLILGIFNLEGVERAKKLFDKKGFHQIGGMYYRN